MASITGEAKKLMSVSTAKSAGFTLAGLYGAHFLANMIPVGAKTGWAQAGKLAAATVAMGYLGDKFLGAEVGGALFTGGSVITALEVVGIISKGKFGAIPTDQAAIAAPSPAQALLPAGGAANQTSQVNSTGNAISNSYASAGF